MKKKIKDNSKELLSKKQTKLKGFKNISLKIKVILPVVFLIIMLMFSGFMSINVARIMLNSSNEISENYTTGLVTIGSISEKFEKMNRIVYAHCLAIENVTREDFIEEYGKLKDEITELCSKYESITFDGEEEKSFINFKSIYQDYLVTYDKAIQLSEANETYKASIVANTTLDKQGDLIITLLDHMKELQKKGMDNAIKKQHGIYNSCIYGAVVLMVAAVLIAVFAVFVCHRYISMPVALLKKELSEIINDIKESKGDLTRRVTVTSRDEIGKTAVGINTFIEELQNIMQKIISSSKKLEDVVGGVTELVATANNNSADISGVMENLTNAMKEVSNNVIEVNQSTKDVDTNVTNLADESKNLLQYADDMKVRASALEQDAVANKQMASDVIGQIIVSIQDAIENSSSVEKVNGLTDEILSISSQTNLLALNASIEAARAGEAGKGFAVVADEIRQLADLSRDTANNIQNINQMVTEAVRKLAGNSNMMVEYIQENILPDYEKFVQAGRQYSDDSLHINSTIEKFNDMANDIQGLTARISEAVDGISAEVEESTSEITIASDHTGELAVNIEEISKEMTNNAIVAGELKEASDKFKAV